MSFCLVIISTGRRDLFVFFFLLNWGNLMYCFMTYGENKGSERQHLVQKSWLSPKVQALDQVWIWFTIEWLIWILVRPWVKNYYSNARTACCVLLLSVLVLNKSYHIAGLTNRNWEFLLDSDKSLAIYLRILLNSLILHLSLIINNFCEDKANKKLFSVSCLIWINQIFMYHFLS